MKNGDIFSKAIGGPVTLTTVPTLKENRLKRNKTAVTASLQRLPASFV